MAVPSVVDLYNDPGQSPFAKAAFVVLLYFTSRSFYDCLLYWTGAEPAEARSVGRRPDYKKYVCVLSHPPHPPCPPTNSLTGTRRSPACSGRFGCRSSLTTRRLAGRARRRSRRGWRRTLIRSEVAYNNKSDDFIPPPLPSPYLFSYLTYLRARNVSTLKTAMLMSKKGTESHLL